MIIIEIFKKIKESKKRMNTKDLAKRIEAYTDVRISTVMHQYNLDNSNMKLRYTEEYVKSVEAYLLNRLPKEVEREVHLSVKSLQVSLNKAKADLEQMKNHLTK